jgi:hypothetical protein
LARQQKFHQNIYIGFTDGMTGVRYIELVMNKHAHSSETSSRDIKLENTAS